MAPKDYELLAPFPCVVSVSGGCAQGSTVTTVSFQQYVLYAMNLLIALAAVAAVFMIVYGGLEYMTTGSFQGKGDGIKKVQNALIGLLLVLCSYLILGAINPAFVNIPSTLVPQLSTQLKPNLTQPVTIDFFDQLTQDAKAYNAQTSEYGQQMTQEKATVTSLQQNLTSLKAQQNELLYSEGVSDTDPRLASVNAKIQDTTNQIADAQAAATILTAQTEISAQMNGGNSNNFNSSGDSVTQTKTLQDVRNNEDNVNKAYNEGLQNLQLLGADTPDNIKKLDSTYYYNYGQLLLQDSILQNAPVDGIKQVNSQVINGILNNMSADDPNKAKLQASITTTMAKLCNPNFGAPNDPACKK